jgi:hypothetical protein
LGAHTVTITVTDDAGNSVTCAATVTVRDTTPPTISQCAPSQNVNAVADCQGQIPDLTGMVSASDNCDSNLTVTQDPAAGTSADVGTHTVVLTVTDDAGNNATCTATVTVSDMTSLRIRRDGPNVVISWPASAPCDYVLEKTAELAATPPSSWEEVMEPVVVMGSENTVTVPIDDDKQFFRLRFP